MDVLEAKTPDEYDNKILENCQFGNIKCFPLCPLFDQEENMCRLDIVGVIFGKVVEFAEKFKKRNMR